MTATISNRTVEAAVFARASTVVNAAGFRGEAANVPLKAGETGVAVPYWVLHWPPGAPDVELDLGDATVDRTWTFQITCAGGDVEDVIALTDRVLAVFYRWTPTVSGLVFGPCRPPAGFDPGPVRPDRDFTPHRYFVPLQFVTTATAN